MGLFDWVIGWLGWGPRPPAQSNADSRSGPAIPNSSHRAGTDAVPRARVRRYPRPSLTNRLYRKSHGADRSASDRRVTGNWPYKFARRAPDPSQWLDLSQDAVVERLTGFGLPALQTPEDLARWLQVDLGELAWLSGHFWSGGRPESLAKSHYHYCWFQKRNGGRRLIEAPKARLKYLQSQILRCILDRVPPHAAAHGFVAGRSIVTNAQPHVGQRVLVQFDLRDFYPSVSYSRVVALFRSLGFSREVSCWLGRLTTAACPEQLFESPSAVQFASRDFFDRSPYLRRHLPQGAPTSPALANLSAFVLDLRLSGLARTFGANYTRYADDLTFSGDLRFQRSLAVFIPLVHQIIRQERFTTHPGKFRVLRRGNRQSVTGVVVNDRVNSRREDFDQLKAILHNCVRLGPTSQNRNQHPDFAGHLRGRIAHAQMLNRHRGARLKSLFDQIDWNK